MLLDLEASPELLGDSELTRIWIDIHVSPRAVLSKMYRVPALRALEAREADPLPELATMEETLEGSIQTVGESLYRTLRDVLRVRASAASLESTHEVELVYE